MSKTAKTITQSLARQAERALQVEDYGKSEVLLLQAYDVARTIFGPDHGEVGLILLRLAEVCRMQGKTALADAYLNETDRIARFYEETTE